MSKETIVSMGKKVQLATACKNAALEENKGLIEVIRRNETTITEQQARIEELEKVVKAPVDNGIKSLDELCDQYNKGEIGISKLVCSIWNEAIASQ